MNRVLFLGVVALACLLASLSCCGEKKAPPELGGASRRFVRHLCLAPADLVQPVRCVMVSGDTVICASPSRIVAISVKSGAIVWQVDGIDAHSLASIPGADKFVCGVSADGCAKLEVRDLRTGAVDVTLARLWSRGVVTSDPIGGAASYIRALAVDEAAKFILAGGNPPLSMWRVPGAEAREFWEDEPDDHVFSLSRGEGVRGVAFVGDDQHVLGIFPKSPTLAEFDYSGRRVNQWQDPNTILTALDSRGGSIVCANNAGCIRSLTPELGESRVVGKHRGRVRSIALSHDGRTVLSIGADGMLRAFDVRACLQIAELDVGRDAARLATNRSWVAVGGRGVSVYRLE